MKLSNIILGTLVLGGIYVSTTSTVVSSPRPADDNTTGCPVTKVQVSGVHPLTQYDVAWAAQAAQTCAFSYTGKPCLLKFDVAKLADGTTAYRAQCGVSQ